MEKYILTFVRGSGSVWVHLSTILRVQVWFRFTEVKFSGSGSVRVHQNETVHSGLRFGFRFGSTPWLFVWHLSRRIVRMESAEKWAAIYRKKPSRDWLEKDQWESVISVQSLSCIRIQLYSTKRIRIQLKDCTLMTLSHWSFSSQSRLGFFL